ncbi:MAG: tRNA pseudouridine synthase A [candidate division TM6 bacterium GW2011_GWF2_38_10]|nr:MAG: tRNA pseudouridine synthase A [candidate division TM6 bacterium GW2011_GWF2_38_10]
MKKYIALIAYDGTDFSGWQEQPTAPTVASTLQKTFLKVFNQPITVIGASRTDAGVHALGQIASFSCDLPLPPHAMKEAWNNRLPKSIFIRDISLAQPDFHPHKHVLQKTYYYHLFFNRPNPFTARFGWYYEFTKKVDFTKFEEALSLYHGEHDFTSFCRIEDKHKSPIRTIDHVSTILLPEYDALRIIIKGKSFLQFQIRRMIGYALDVARRKDLPVCTIQDMLNNPNPQQTLLKADGCGLCLRKVLYHDQTTMHK